MKTIFMLRKIFGDDNFNKIGFDDIVYFIKYPSNKFILINTLPINEQSFLIKGTISFQIEEKIINDSLKHYDEMTIIIYGKNNVDDSVEIKYRQLQNLGYSRNNLFIYYGGLLEWSLLQDIYGNDNFQTTSYNIDVLKYKSERILMDSYRI
jgi:hypothetical protein